MTRATLEIYKMRSGRLQWRLFGGNGEKLCRGSQARGFGDVRSLWHNVLISTLSLAGVYGQLLPDKAPRPGRTITNTWEGHQLTVRRAA